MKPEKEDEAAKKNKADSARPKSKGCLAETLGDFLLQIAIYPVAFFCFLLVDALNIKSTWAQVAFVISPFVLLAIYLAWRAKKSGQ